MPKPPAKSDLPVLDQADANAGHAGLPHGGLDEAAELRDPRLVEPVRLPSGEGLARVPLGQQLTVHQGHLGEALLSHRLGHVVQRDGPHPAGALYVHAHVALFVG